MFDFAVEIVLCMRTSNSDADSKSFRGGSKTFHNKSYFHKFLFFKKEKFHATEHVVITKV